MEAWNCEPQVLKIRFTEEEAYRGVEDSKSSGAEERRRIELLWEYCSRDGEQLSEAARPRGEEAYGGRRGEEDDENRPKP